MSVERSRSARCSSGRSSASPRSPARPGSSRTVTVPRIQKPGLALTGWPEQLHPRRVLVLGGTEIEYLADQRAARAARHRRRCSRASRRASSCAAGSTPPEELRDAAEARGVPVLVSTLVTADFIAAVTAWMADRLAPSTELHGVLMDVLGIGVLVVGKSGIGKSETALDLVVRGHRLVADDVIVIRRTRQHACTGRGAGILGHHMEIRGLGIINIKDLFGISAVREAKKIELVVELHEWDAATEYDRLGFDEHARAAPRRRGARSCRCPGAPGPQPRDARSRSRRATSSSSCRALTRRAHSAISYIARWSAATRRGVDAVE